MVLWRSRHLPCVFKEYLETRNNLEENENLWIQDLHLGDPQVRSETRGPLVLYRSPSSTSDFIHIFSWFNKCVQPQIRGRQPQGQDFHVNRNLLSLRSFATSLKNICMILYNFFHDFIHVYSPRTGADNPLGTKFWCQQEPLVTSCHFSHMLQVSKNLLEDWFYTINVH